MPDSQGHSGDSTTKTPTYVETMYSSSEVYCLKGCLCTHSSGLQFLSVRTVHLLQEGYVYMLSTSPEIKGKRLFRPWIHA